MDREYFTKTQYLDFVEHQFEKCFHDNGFIKEAPVKITSGVDHTVHLVGSCISPLKKYVLSGTIGDAGRFLIQNCMRTRGIKNIMNTELTIYGCYFKNMGIVAEPDSLQKVVSSSFDYLLNYLNLSHHDLRIRISSQDKDLLESIENVDNEVIREIDTMSENYYRHKYGLDEYGIFGRNFNIAMRKRGTNFFNDLGNIIVMENNKKKFAIEMGFGNQTFAMSHFAVECNVESSRMADIFEINSIERIKLADSMIGASILQYEGVHDDAKCSRKLKRILRQYCSALEYWKNKLAIHDELIVDYMKGFISLEFKNQLFKGELYGA
jgi:hypothetical protein